MDFFKEYPDFLGKAGPLLTASFGADWEKRLEVKEVQTNFVHMMVLFNYYKRVYHTFFSPEENVGTNHIVPISGASAEETFPPHLQFGWMLFLSLRVHALSPFPDLVSCTNALLSVIIFMILHMPISLRKFSLDDTTLFGVRSTGGVHLIASLCNLYHASENDVTEMLNKTSGMVIDIFKDRGRCTSADDFPENLAGINKEGWSYFEFLMDDKLLVKNLQILDKNYEEAYHHHGELDERIFLSSDQNLIATMSSGSPITSGIKQKYDVLSSPVPLGSVSGLQASSSPIGSPFSSPVKSGSLPVSNKMPPPTPVSITMTTAKWLRTVIAPLSSEPLPELQVFLRSCDRDITADVAYRAQVILEGIFPSDLLVDGCNRVIDADWGKQRRLEALKLYYRVLGAMCRAESQRLHCTNLTALLSNERFHRCMLACSAELVLATHKTVTMLFPAVLEPIGITPFDLSKVIESFVRHEDTLPRELKRHLNSIEERLLESMAWEKGSSMYNSLVIAKPKLAQEIHRLGLLAGPLQPIEDLIPHHHRLLQNIAKGDSSDEALENLSSKETKVPTSLALLKGVATVSEHIHPGSIPLTSPSEERASAFSAFPSLKSRNQAPLQSTFASPQRPSPRGAGETCAETVISVFFQKVLKLAAIRIRMLLERLRQSNQVMEQVYHAIQHALHHVTSLFFNRHIDQLILCCIYGVCKVSKLNLTFKEIIYQYRKLPQCKPQVFRNVFIDLQQPGRRDGHETGDIIRFYNEIFVPSTKCFLLLLGPNPTSFSVNGRSSDEIEKGDGNMPESPRLSSFPVLPDMSPKKISANQNVYVSPLRSTKMESLMSPQSRHLYACVGESTHAYQSPSKDLAAINNRLNSRRPGRIDFGEPTLVSDSAVGGGLYSCMTHRLNGDAVRLTTDSALTQSQSPWKHMAPPASPLKRPRLDR
ncbi:hypothetical protein O6H91_21G040500 [Diphasiastrum complanatum]|uniref:Uncharacterized protein n=1 Tax=Diphasiastrum complanatum TaxID=34168 RepID=A0ACC2AJN4_DIPCM|nr:hypothetical protein O6H91_21G040500 [Diphasiastrum complanatum]